MGEGGQWARSLTPARTCTHAHTHTRSLPASVAAATSFVDLVPPMREEGERHFVAAVREHEAQVDEFTAELPVSGGGGVGRALLQRTQPPTPTHSPSPR